MNSGQFDVGSHLERLVGHTIATMSGHENRIIAIEADHVIVATKRSPQGQPIPISDVQAAFDELAAEGELAIETTTVGYRSAFVGATLLTIPGVERVPGTRRLMYGPT